MLRLPKNFSKREKATPASTPASTPKPDHDKFFIKYISLTFFTLIWPWLLFVIFRRKDGIPIRGRFAGFLQNNPKDTTFFFTTVGNLIKAGDGFLFSKAVTSYAKKWVSTHDTPLFLLSFFDALKSPRISWPFGRLSQFVVKKRWRLYVVVAFFFVVVLFQSSGIVSLLTPASFLRKGSLDVKELNFAPTDKSCIDWFSSNTLTPNCDWLPVDPVNGMRFTTCLAENQLVDVLESGRGNMLSSLQQTASFSLAQVGVTFAGSTRGVLPNGPRGTINTSPFADAAVAHTAFNYTLDLQGVASQISCMYTPSSIVTITELSPDLWQYSGTCPDGQQEILLGLDSQNVLQKANFTTLASDNFLGFWACKAKQTGSSGDLWEIHYRGGGKYYADMVSNVMCTISDFLPAVFPVDYQSQRGLFVVGEQKQTSLSSSTELADLSVKELGSVVVESQNKMANIFIESITTFKAKYLNLDPKQRDTQFLRLLERMTQGVLEYEAMYIRLLYHLQATTGTLPAPPNCFQTITGQGSYELFGWFATPKTGIFLLPVTILNLASLALFFMAMQKGDRDLIPFDFTDPEACVYGSDQFAGLRNETKNQLKDARVWHEHIKCQELYSYRPAQQGVQRPKPVHFDSSYVEAEDRA